MRLAVLLAIVAIFVIARVSKKEYGTDSPALSRQLRTNKALTTLPR